MDHNPIPVAGYSPQSDEKIELVNFNKDVEERILRLLDGLQAGASLNGYDGRWLAIGRTHIEQGFMAVNRSIFRPGRVNIQGDAT